MAGFEVTIEDYRRRSIQMGEWSRDWWELIIDKKLIRELRCASASMVRSNRIMVPFTPVNANFAALIDCLANDSRREFVLPEQVCESDLEFNVSRARPVLAGKRGLAGSWSRSEIAKELVRGAKRCGACRSYLIRGFRIRGRKITRAREYCDDACKMKAERQKRRMDNRFDGGTISSDAGGVLLREVERGCGMLKRVAGCFRDYRDPASVRLSGLSINSWMCRGL